MFYTTPVLVFPSNTVIAQYKTYYEQNGYVTNIFINLSLGHISNTRILYIYNCYRYDTVQTPKGTYNGETLPSCFYFHLRVFGLVFHSLSRLGSVAPLG